MQLVMKLHEVSTHIQAYGQGNSECNQGNSECNQEFKISSLQNELKIKTRLKIVQMNQNKVDSSTYMYKLKESNWESETTYMRLNISMNPNH